MLVLSLWITLPEPVFVIEKIQWLIIICIIILNWMFPFVSRVVLCDPCELPYFVCFMFFMLVCVAFCILPIFLSTEQVDSLLKPY